MGNQSNKWAGEGCKENAWNFCFIHRAAICTPCTIDTHFECKVDTIKTQHDVGELVQYLKILVSRLKEICDDKMAENMIKRSIDAMRPYFFEFNIFRANFKKLLKDNHDDIETWTIMFHKFQVFHKSLKENAAYGKVIEFEFEQKICQLLKQENESKSTNDNSPENNQIIRKGKIQANNPNAEFQVRRFSIHENEKPLESEPKPKRIPIRRISMGQSGIKNLMSEQNRGDHSYENWNSDYETNRKIKPITNRQQILDKRKKILMTPERNSKRIEFVIRPISDNQNLIKDLKHRLGEYRKNHANIES